MKLLHFSNYEIEKFNVTNRQGIYFFESEDDYFENLINNHHNNYEGLSENASDQQDIQHAGWYYGDNVYLVSVSDFNLLDLTDEDDFNNFIKSNKKVKSELEKEMENINEDDFNFFDYYNNITQSPFEYLINKTAIELGFDIIKIKDSTEGNEHNTIIVLDSSIIKFK